MRYDTTKFVHTFLHITFHNFGKHFGKLFFEMENGFLMYKCWWVEPKSSSNFRNVSTESRSQKINRNAFHMILSDSDFLKAPVPRSPPIISFHWIWLDYNKMPHPFSRKISQIWMSRDKILVKILILTCSNIDEFVNNVNKNYEFSKILQYCPFDRQATKTFATPFHLLFL